MAGMLTTSYRLVARSFSRNPIVIIAAILSLSLAIGANTALFSITDQMLLRLLPVKDPQRLVSFNWHGEFIGGSSRGLPARLLARKKLLSGWRSVRPARRCCG
jgi:hypothetical protein